MKIKEFSEKHNVPISTLRYYINIGLLRPEKKNSQWLFGNEDSQRLSEILSYKSCGFPLKTIKLIQQYNYSDTLDQSTKIEGIKNILNQEHEKLLNKRRKIDQALLLLKKHNNNNDNVRNYNNTIPLHMFGLISCPHCNVPLNWKFLRVINNSVIEGQGECTCGFKGEIVDGILYTSNNNILIESIDTNFETTRKRTARDISTLEKYFFWLFQRLNSDNLKGKILFEDTINLICFTAKALPLFNTIPDIILADSNPDAICYYSHVLKSIRPNSNILLIVDDGVNHPIKQNCLDIIIDYCSSEIIQSYGYSSVFSILKKYAKKSTKVFGRFSYLYKNMETKNAMFNPTKNIRYDLNLFKRSLYQNNILILEEMLGQEDLDISIYNRSLPNEIIRPYVFYGQMVTD